MPGKLATQREGPNVTQPTMALCVTQCRCVKRQADEGNVRSLHHVG